MTTVTKLRAWLNTHPGEYVIAVGEDGMTLEVAPTAPADPDTLPYAPYFEIGMWPKAARPDDAADAEERDADRKIHD
jgi:hypothetical protein